MAQNERPLERPAAWPAIGAQTPDQADHTPARDRPYWLTYAQVGELLGLSPEAVRHRARRSGWRTMPGNDGRTLVLVPDDVEPVRTHDRTAVRTPDQAEEAEADPRAHDRVERAFEAALSAVQAAHSAEVTALREQADMAEQARIAAETRADRAETAIASERQRADGLRDRLNTMQEQLSDAHAALQAASAADARADRAEADRAEERGRADRAEAATAAERARADTLRERIEALQGQLTARQEVIDAAETTRRAEDVRRARGRWARLRAAWRGE